MLNVTYRVNLRSGVNDVNGLWCRDSCFALVSLPRYFSFSLGGFFFFFAIMVWRIGQSAPSHVDMKDSINPERTMERQRKSERFGRVIDEHQASSLRSVWRNWTSA